MCNCKKQLVGIDLKRPLTKITNKRHQDINGKICSVLLGFGITGLTIALINSLVIWYATK